MIEDGEGQKRAALAPADGSDSFPKTESLDPASEVTGDPLLRAAAEISEPSLSEVAAHSARGSRTPLRSGAIVAKRYRLEHQIGRGGMGVVWEATHLVTRRRVAIKFLTGPAHLRADSRRRLLREARAASAANHANVVEVLDVFELEDGTPVMVMELLSGETLRDRLIRDSRLPLDVTASILLPVIAAVGAAHALGIVHRDLKPENIFLHRGPAGDGVKVLDFGVAKLTAQDGAASETDSLTNTGTTLGTPCYMAPEQTTAERDIDARADIWALGVILYECLAGVRPVGGSGIGQVVMQLVTKGINPLGQVVSGLPPGAATLVMRMLARERSDRPQDLREVEEALAPFAHATTRGDAADDPTTGAPDAVAQASPVDTKAPHGLATSVPRAPRRSSITVAIGAGAVLTALLGWRLGVPVRHLSSSQAQAVAAAGAATPPQPLAPPGSRLEEAIPTAATTPVVASAPSPPSTSAAAASRIRRYPAASAVSSASSAPPSAASAAPPPASPPPAESAPATVASVPVGTPSCDPPYEFDSHGRKMWKRQCL
jgi:serine/threonine-protein kinase